MNIAIVGCGLIGRKRAQCLGGHRLAAVTDVVRGRAEELAQPFGASVAASWDEIAARKDVDAVFVATPHDHLVPAAMAAVASGKHVLLEKPGARNAAELKPLLEAARRKGVVVKVGFNHRFHPAMLKAKEYADSGVLGELMFVRGRYGHGGRVSYDKEWRADPAISGGGELLDQGMHLIDLSRWFMGDFSKVDGFTRTYFWDMPVDDNGFMMLRTPKDQVAWLHVSWTEWKNMFSFEIYGKKAKLHVEGLGGSYGVERLSFYKMSPEMGPPETVIHEFPGADLSWEREFRNFTESVESHGTPCGNLDDAYEALKIVDAVYGAKK
jgi:predicted dehydrogenase